MVAWGEGATVARSSCRSWCRISAGARGVSPSIRLRSRLYSCRRTLPNAGELLPHQRAELSGRIAIHKEGMVEPAPCGPPNSPLLQVSDQPAHEVQIAGDILSAKLAHKHRHSLGKVAESARPIGAFIRVDMR